MSPKLNNAQDFTDKLNELYEKKDYKGFIFHYHLASPGIFKTETQKEFLPKYNEFVKMFRENAGNDMPKILVQINHINSFKSLDSQVRFDLIILFIIVAWILSPYIKDIKRTLEQYLKIKQQLINTNTDEKREEAKNELKKKTSLFGLFDSESEFKFAENVKDRLADVKGIDEVREEIEEIVSMLKNPEKYEEAGAKLIRGILLVGRPGTGKTLLARALAGESGVNFLYITASEFDKGLVGQGSKKMKEMFEAAKMKQPCIIFIDEIDSLLHKGRRSGKYSSSSDRGLINTFLSEMDGFENKNYVFVLGATNFEDNLDSAALRPGRFDKIINVPIPDSIGRKEIFDLYMKKIKLIIKNDIDSQILSKMTPGFTGAEIENLVNHAIITAVDKSLLEITKQEFEDARDRILLGLKKKTGFKNDKQLLYSAVHEAGHTLVCYLNALCKESIFKVTVIPRGNNRGKTSTLFDDREGNKKEFQTMIDMALGGVIAEEIYFGNDKVSVGCGNDLNKATNLANSMVKKYGMNSSDWGYMTVEDSAVVEHRISSHSRDNLDTATQKIIENSEKRVRNILTENVDKLKELAQYLCVYDELNKEDIENIFNNKFDHEQKTKKREFQISSMAL